MLFLDIAKTFDTISQRTILEVARAAGIPNPLVNCLACLCGRGVKQGNPLCPLLFILAMDKAVQAAWPKKGIKIGDRHVKAIAYADNLILIARNREDFN